MSRPVETGTATRSRNSRKHKTIIELIDLIIRQGESSELLDCTTRQLIKRCPNLETLGIDFTEKKAFRAFNQFWTELKIDIKAGTLVLSSVSSSSAAAQEAQPNSLSSSAAQEPAQSNLVSMTHPSPSFASGSNQESSNYGDSLVPRTYENACLGTLDQFTTYIGVASSFQLFTCPIQKEALENGLKYGGAVGYAAIKVIEKHKVELGTVQNVLAGCLSHAEQEIEECDLKMEDVRRECNLRTKEARKKIAFLQGPVKGFSDTISELALASQRTAANCMTPQSIRVDRPPLAPTISPARPAQQFTSTLHDVSMPMPVFINAPSTPIGQPTTGGFHFESSPGGFGSVGSGLPLLYGASGGASGSRFAQGSGISFGYSAPSSIADKENAKPFEISLRKRKPGSSSSDGPHAKKPAH
jgi:hypothetical protein